MITTKQIEYRPLTGYKYQTTEIAQAHAEWLDGHTILTAHGLISVADGTLTIQPGYAWDGTTGPTIDRPDNMRASLFHDALCQLTREGYLKGLLPKIDKLFVDMCREDGMRGVRLWYHSQVRRFTPISTRRQDPPPPLTAP